MAEREQGIAERTLADGRTLSVRWAAASDIGARRDSNQDAFLAAFPLFVVADGMGGHAGGEIASRATVAQMRAVVDSGVVETHTIEEAIERATAEILSHPEAADEGTGTTLTGFFFAEADAAPEEGAAASWIVLNIGDSRVYLVRGEGIAQVTTDHSVVQEMIASGRLRSEEAEGHPYSNVITRAVGSGEQMSPDFFRVDLEDGDVFVVCSDGLTKELTDYGILHFVSSHSEPVSIVDAMLSAALENGGRDNITVIVVRAETAHTSSTKRTSHK